MAVYNDIFGTLLGERYRIDKALGAGAFGQVFRATHEIFEVPLRTVALKLFTKDYVTRDNAAHVFKEALLMEQLAAEARSRGKQLNLVAIYDAGVLKDYQHIPYVAMEYVDGGSLEDQLRQAGRFPLATVIRHLRDICAGLRLAHEATPALIHRDLKPGNVLITRTGFIKVADFGVAIDRYEALLQGGGGEIVYSPPESCRGIAASPAFDIYSLGVMAVEMLSGENPLSRVWQKAKESGRAEDEALAEAQAKLADLIDPLSGCKLTETLPELGQHKAFQKILESCLAWEVDARFANAQALDKALAGCQDNNTYIELSSQPVKDSPEGLLRAAWQQMEWGALKEAQCLFEQVRATDPRNPRVYTGLSQLYEQQNQFAEAIRQQEIGLKYSLTQESLQRLACLCKRAGRDREAQSYERLAKLLKGGRS